MARIIFMGTPDFAVPSLKALIAGDHHHLVAVVTQPDRPSGRGKKLTPPPVKIAARQAGVPVLQPATLKTDEAFAELSALEPDLIVVAAFGQILRQNVLTLPPHGCINVHASLLPRWRGAAPITAAIKAGDAETGITIMRMDKGLDTGDIISKRAVPIRPEHTGGTLTDELAQLGADLLLDTLPGWLSGQIKSQPQDDSLATLAPRLKKKEGELDWNTSAVEIERLVRAFSPWPGTFTWGPRGQIKILALDVAPKDVVSKFENKPPGTLIKHGKQIFVVAGNGVLHLKTVQPAGKKAMDAISMLNGQPELLDIGLGQPE